MKLINLLNLQKAVEEREIPYDILALKTTHHSQSKDTEINILDLHLTHAIRILNNYLEDNVYPKYSDRQEIFNDLNSIRGKLDDISDVVNK